MSLTVFGNLRGLSPSEKKAVERLYRRRLSADELITVDLARELYSVSESIGRRVGLLVTREGDIEQVFVGDKNILYLPDLGRYRLGRGRLRRLRLLFADLSRDPERAHIPHDIYTDLERLRLDAVVSLKIRGQRTMMSFAHLHHGGDPTDAPIKTEEVGDLTRFELDFSERISSLEDELTETVARKVSSKPRAVLIGVYPKGYREVDSSVTELRELARTAEVEVVGEITQKRDIDPRTLLGKGKLEEVILQCLRLEADLLIFDLELRPAQWRAITNATELKVIDRSMLILDIFAQRAASAAGKLQVELAQLKYNLPRLVEKDAGLSRLSGGIGGRGPGETKLEIGRRRIRDRIADLERQIDQLSDQRHLRRKRQQESATALVAILGYTNVGKSTLFNALTKSDVIVENKLFATLDPAKRRLEVPDANSNSGRRAIVVSDTVGFIRQLPKELVTSFKATLEELTEAQAFVHVLDASDPEILARRDAVLGILESMGLLGTPMLTVINKIDQAAPEIVVGLVRELEAIPISARNGQGLENLKSEMGRLIITPVPKN